MFCNSCDCLGEDSSECGDGGDIDGEGSSECGDGGDVDGEGSSECGDGADDDGDDDGDDSSECGDGGDVDGEGSSEYGDGGDDDGEDSSECGDSRDDDGGVSSECDDGGDDDGEGRVSVVTIVITTTKQWVAMKKPKTVSVVPMVMTAAKTEAEKYSTSLQSASGHRCHPQPPHVTTLTSAGHVFILTTDSSSAASETYIFQSFLSEHYLTRIKIIVICNHHNNTVPTIWQRFRLLYRPPPWSDSSNECQQVVFLSDALNFQSCNLQEEADSFVSLKAFMRSHSTSE